MSNIASSRNPKSETLLDAAHRGLSGLCRGLDLEHLEGAAVEAFQHLSEPWCHWRVGTSPKWDNDICDDGSPFEFSVAFGAHKPELRMLTEPQLSEIAPTSNWDAGLLLLERLKRRYDADSARFQAIADLFAPRPDVAAHFYAWSAAVLGASVPLFKLYLNPHAAGPEQAHEVIREAFARLGMAQQLVFLVDRLGSEAALQRARYFALDLSHSAHARVKVYLSEPDGEALEGLVAGSRNAGPGAASNFLQTITESSNGDPRRPPLVCFAFDGRTLAPEATLHVPVRCYVSNDGDALNLVRRTLEHVNGERLSRAVQSLVPRPLVSSRGVITYASIRPHLNEQHRVTVYLAPQLYAPAPDGEGRAKSGTFKRRSKRR